MILQLLYMQTDRSVIEHLPSWQEKARHSSERLY